MCSTSSPFSEWFIMAGEIFASFWLHGGDIMMHRTTVVALVALAILGLTAPNASAQTRRVKGNYVGCMTKAHLDQVTTALNNRDERLYNSLMGKVCVPLKDQEFSILDRGFLTSKIRVYVGSDYVALHVPSEATR